MESNQSIYEDADAIAVYQEARPPQAAELAIFGPLEDELATARLLDIGVGGGRTTRYLAPKVARYVGVDYSHHLVDAAQRAFPDLELLWCDARDLSLFDDSSFDVVYFSFNGIDSIDHVDRLAVLSEVRRVLAPRGRFIFSSHNRDYARRGLLPWQGRPRPGRVTLKKSWEAVRAHRNRRRLRPLQVEHDEYALVNDEAHGWSLLHYYISPAHQRTQLETAGFSEIEVWDQWGTRTDAPSPASIWMYYACRRP